MREKEGEGEREGQRKGKRYDDKRFDVFDVFVLTQFCLLRVLALSKIMRKPSRIRELGESLPIYTDARTIYIIEHRSRALRIGE